MPDAARSRATGSVSPTRPPFDAAYAAWPICPSNAATDDTLTIAPRSPAGAGLVGAQRGGADADGVERAIQVARDDPREGMVARDGVLLSLGAVHALGPA